MNPFNSFWLRLIVVLCVTSSLFVSAFTHIRHLVYENEWPEPGDILTTLSVDDFSIVMEEPTHRAVIHCLDNELRATTPLVFNVFVSGHAPYNASYVDLLDLQFLVDATMISSGAVVSAPLIAYFKSSNTVKQLLPGRRLLGITVRKQTSKDIVTRLLLEIQVVCTHTRNEWSPPGNQSGEGVIDINEWSNYNIESGQSTQTTTKRLEKDFSGDTTEAHEDFHAKLIETENNRAPFSRKAYFEAVYEQAYWSAGDLNAPSLSGVGSTLSTAKLANEAIIDIVVNSAARFGIRRIIDIPCGDMAWLNIPLLQKHNVSYLGMDIVESVINRNQKKFALEENRTSNVNFRQFDIVSDSFAPIAMGQGDLLITRSLMIHLPIADNIFILNKIATSGVQYALLTTFLRADENTKEFVLAMSHKINLFKSPYCLYDPLVLYREVTEDMYLGLWDMSSAFIAGIDSQDTEFIVTKSFC